MTERWRKRLSPLDGRTADRVVDHYRIEKELASRLRDADKEARRGLYTAVYDELFSRVPDHPAMTQKTAHASGSVTDKTDTRLALLHPFLQPTTTYLEIGPGDCALALRVALRVRRVYAVEVSQEITARLDPPQNFILAISDGTSVPIPANSIDLAFSDQLMEHLHPDDACDQLRAIYRAIRPGGGYLCTTPNRLTGPHDVSQYFDEVATGFHLKEYTVGELACLFRQIGFRNLRVLLGPLPGGSTVRVPVSIVVIAERVFAALPLGIRIRLCRSRIVRSLWGLKLYGQK